MSEPRSPRGTNSHFVLPTGGIVDWPAESTIWWILKTSSKLRDQPVYWFNLKADGQISVREFVISMHR